jgi:hypothetical protein
VAHPTPHLTQESSWPQVGWIAQRSDGVSTRWAKALRRGAVASALLIAGFGVAAPSAAAASTTLVDLGTASTYAVLSGASVDNTVSAPDAPHTTLRGNLGVKANAQPTGFPPGVVTGALYVGNAAAAQAHADLVTAYNQVAGGGGGGGPPPPPPPAHWPARPSPRGCTPSPAPCRTPER